MDNNLIDEYAYYFLKCCRILKVSLPVERRSPIEITQSAQNPTFRSTFNSVNSSLAKPGLLYSFGNKLTIVFPVSYIL